MDYPLKTSFNTINWLTLHELYCKALACMVFKCVHQLAPVILANRFILLDDVALRTTRNSHQLKLKPNKYKTEFFKRSLNFVNAGILE